MDRKLLAYNNFKQGYNCCQAVLLAFSDVLPLSFEELRAVSAAFGGGFSRTRNLCGTMSAAGMVLGLLETYSGDIAADKKDIYKNVRSITDKFEEINGTIICGDLLKNIRNITKDYAPEERTEEYYRVRPCVKFVMEAVELIENSELYKAAVSKKESV